MTREPAILTILGLGSEGDGLVDGGTGPIFIPGALPGETLRRTPEGAFEPTGSSSPERRGMPLCPHVSRCGGCTVQHMGDALYRRWKSGLLDKELRQSGVDHEPANLIVVPGGTRRRAVLTGVHAGSAFALGYHGQRSHAIEAISACAVLKPAIVAALPLLAKLTATVTPQRAEARATILDTPGGLDIAFEVKASPLDATRRTRLARLASESPIARITLNGEPLLLRARPILQMAAVAVTPPPGAFVQAAEEAEIAMQSLALEAVGKSKHVADLFSGLGTFTFALARKARVTAIDSNRGLITALTDAARHAEGLKPIEGRVRDLFHDPLSVRELEAFDAVVLDPPRAGAKAQAAALARSKVKTIVAVSCNPATLARDLRILIDGGYRLDTVTPIDQFLYTAHLEAVAVLRR